MSTEQPDQAVHPEAVERWGGWDWNEPRYGEHFRRCDYCGSIHPDDLAAETDWSANWADRKYGWPHKFYVDVPSRTPNTLFVIEAGYGPAARYERILTPGSGYVLWNDLTDEQREICAKDGWMRGDGSDPTYVRFGPRRAHHAKFYSIHLCDAGIDRSVKRAIEQRCGLRFAFAGTRVHWMPVEG